MKRILIFIALLSFIAISVILCEKENDNDNGLELENSRVKKITFINDSVSVTTIINYVYDKITSVNSIRIDSKTKENSYKEASFIYSNNNTLTIFEKTNNNKQVFTYNGNSIINYQSFENKDSSMQNTLSRKTIYEYTKNSLSQVTHYTMFYNSNIEEPSEQYSYNNNRISSIISDVWQSIYKYNNNNQIDTVKTIYNANKYLKTFSKYSYSGGLVKSIDTYSNDANNLKLSERHEYQYYSNGLLNTDKIYLLNEKTNAMEYYGRLEYEYEEGVGNYNLTEKNYLINQIKGIPQTK